MTNTLKLNINDVESMPDPFTGIGELFMVQGSLRPRR